MAERLWRTIITRLTAPPLALKVHAALVMAAAFGLADANLAGWWAGPAIAVILLWALLGGSRFVWWVQLVGLGIVLLNATLYFGDVVDRWPGASLFVDVTEFVAFTAVIAAAWVILLLPHARRHCRVEHSRRNAFVFALGVYLVAWFPVRALGVGAHLPSRGMLEHTRGAVFVGGDPGGPVAFYVAENKRRTCLIVLQPRSGSRSCGPSRDDRYHPSPVHASDVLVDLVPKTVERVEMETSEGIQTARMIVSERSSLALYYLLDAPWQEIRRVTGYDSFGHVVYRAEEDY